MSHDVLFRSFIATYDRNYNLLSNDELNDLPLVEFFELAIEHNEVNFVKHIRRLIAPKHFLSENNLPTPFGNTRYKKSMFSLLAKIKTPEMDNAVLAMKRTTPEMHFLTAIMGNNIGRVRYLIEKGVNVTETVIFDIHGYVSDREWKSNHKEYQLPPESKKLEAYLDVDWYYLNSTECPGWNALTLAAYHDNVELFQLLVDAGCNELSVGHDHDADVLSIATQCSNRELIEYLTE